MPLQNGQAIRAKFKEESDSDWWSDFDTDRLVQLELRLFWSSPRWTASLAYLQSAVIWTWNSRKDVLLLFLFTKVKLKRKECLKRLWWELKETEFICILWNAWWQDVFGLMFRSMSVSRCHRLCTDFKVASLLLAGSSLFPRPLGLCRT